MNRQHTSPTFLASFVSLSVAFAVVVGGCSSDDAAGPTQTTESAVSSTTQEFVGDVTSEFCDLARRVFGTVPSQESEMDEVREQFLFVDDVKAELIATAPEEIREDVEEFVRWIDLVGEAFAEVDYDRAQLDADDVEATDVAAEAGTRVKRYHDHVCEESDAPTPNPSEGSVDEAGERRETEEPQ